MKTLLTLATLTFLAACGNPHISSRSSGTDVFAPPLIGDCSAFTITTNEFIFGDQSDPFYPTKLAQARACRTTINEDFNSYPTGHTLLATNAGQAAITYEIVHREAALTPGHVDTFFGTTNYNMEIQNPVTQYGASGTDRGLNSTDADPNFLDTLVLEFSAPISYFAARVVSFKKDSTIRLFGCDGMLIQTQNVTYPNNQPGKDFVHHLGFLRVTADVCYVAMTGVHNTAPVAIDDLFYGI